MQDGDSKGGPVGGGRLVRWGHLWRALRSFRAKIGYRIFLARSGLLEADQIPTHLTPVEKRALFRAAADQGGTIVEIGSYLGASACFLAGGLQCSRRKGTVHCIDSWQNDAMSEGHRDTWEEFCRYTARFGDLIVPHRGRSVDIAQQFSESTDVLFIDGDHSYEGCRSDVYAWLPKVRAGGLVLMHDIGWAEGVQRVIREFVQDRMSVQGIVGDNLWWGRCRA